MKHIQFPPVGDAFVSSVPSQRRSNSVRGYFSRFVEALYEFRRLRAARVIQQHRHLFDRPHKTETANSAVAPPPRSETIASRLLLSAAAVRRVAARAMWAAGSTGS